MLMRTHSYSYIITYIDETWIIKIVKKRIDTFEMLETYAENSRPNDEQINRLRDLNITEKTKNIRNFFKLFHVMRKTDNSLRKPVEIRGKIGGKWECSPLYVDQIAKMTRTSVYDCIQTAENREAWRQRVQELWFAKTYIIFVMMKSETNTKGNINKICEYLIEV